MTDSDLKKQLNNMLKKAEQEAKQAAKKVTKPVHVLDRYFGDGCCSSRKHVLAG